MTAHAALIAAKLQGAHERRQRGEDKDMGKDKDRSVWSPEKREVVDTLAESVYDALLKLAEKNAPDAPQSNAVTAERVVELERQLNKVEGELRDTNVHLDALGVELSATQRELQAAYVAREVPWSDVAAGMMTIARDGTPWMVLHWNAARSAVALANGAQAFEKTPHSGETVRVLVPYVTPEQAEALVRDELGARAVES